MRWKIHHLGVTPDPEAGLPRATIVFGIRLRSAPIDERGPLELRNATLLVWDSDAWSEEHWLDEERVVVRLAGQTVAEVATIGLHDPGDLPETTAFSRRLPLVNKAVSLIWSAGLDLLEVPEARQITWDGRDCEPAEQPEHGDDGQTSR